MCQFSKNLLWGNEKMKICLYLESQMTYIFYNMNICFRYVLIVYVWIKLQVFHFAFIWLYLDIYARFITQIHLLGWPAFWGRENWTCKLSIKCALQIHIFLNETSYYLTVNNTRSYVSYQAKFDIELVRRNLTF